MLIVDLSMFSWWPSLGGTIIVLGKYDGLPVAYRVQAPEARDVRYIDIRGALRATDIFV